MLPGFRKQLEDGAAALREGKARDSGAKANAGGANAVSPEAQRQIDQLKATDLKVRAHEQAHIAVGGDLVRGGASFSYQTGPDKKRYAVAGEVSIDTSKERTAEATIPKAEHIRQTALAPSDPSAQDRQVAAVAAQMEMQARQEVAMQAAEERGRAGSDQASRAIGAYQAAAGVEKSAGFAAIA
ncbi:MAG TPA: putative metalloprotease CJM1_0395 family protein [Rhodocyclaceae bacterium]|nr:putative metalloprotease CJM1_0395 family protein [Rhodocyclaceae bacterium]